MSVTQEQIRELRELYQREIAACEGMAKMMAEWIDQGLALRQRVMTAQANLTRSLELANERLDAE